MMTIVKQDVVRAAGPLQVCSGLEGGCEAAIHAMREIFEDEETEGILLVDAENAFNNLNRKAALHNMPLICPSLATILSNTYQSPTRMIISGRGEITSSEGTTQGDPLGMAMYSLAVLPLIHKLCESHENIKQAWFADDATAASTCHQLRSWWDDLVITGPAFGYFPKPSKTCLVVKEKYLGIAKDTFANTDVVITSHGQRHLGAAIGSTDFKNEYVSQKVKTWCKELELLSKIAVSQLHAAYSAYIHNQASKWSFTMRTVPDTANLFQPLESILREKFIPAITGKSSISDEDRALLALPPPRLGGLGLTNPSREANHCFEASKSITEPLSHAIIQQELDTAAACLESRSTKISIAKEKRRGQAIEAETILEKLPPAKRRLMLCAKERGASSWVTALPIDDHGFFLHKGAFHDAVCLRYDWSLQNMPLYCSCGKSLSVDHAMICQKGGFPILRHNELRDLTANLLKEVHTDTCIEPQLQALDGETFEHRTANCNHEARVDIRSSGFWISGQEAFLDIRVFHPSAPSYCNKNLSTLYRMHEGNKKREYGSRIREVEHGALHHWYSQQQVGWLPNAQLSTNGLLIKLLKREETSTPALCSG